MNKNYIYIFTYGTLKRGFCNHHLLESADVEFVGEGMTLEKYQMYPSINYAFPFLLKSEKNHMVTGELYRTSCKETLKMLDILEGCPDLYVQSECNVKLKDGSKIIKALIYIKNENTNFNSFDPARPIIDWTKQISAAEI